MHTKQDTSHETTSFRAQQEQLADITLIDESFLDEHKPIKFSVVEIVFTGESCTSLTGEFERDRATVGPTNNSKSFIGTEA